jgi:hypothetical protein
MSSGRVVPAALALRALVAVGAAIAVLAAAASYAVGSRPLGPAFGTAAVAVIAAGAFARRLGVALPGQGFSSYIIGVGLFAIVDRGWAFAVLTTPLAILLGDVGLRTAPSTARWSRRLTSHSGSRPLGSRMKRWAAGRACSPSIPRTSARVRSFCSRYRW